MFEMRKFFQCPTCHSIICSSKKGREKTKDGYTKKLYCFTCKIEIYANQIKDRIILKAE